jgi:dihydrofolate synthase/folylpolyglutamate synthase
MAGTPAEDWIEGLDLFGMRFGLDRMHALMDALGHPVRGIRAVHVVGTNGKSSVTRMTAAILTAHGMRTGAYVSPHVLGWHERIALNGVPISSGAFAHAADRVRAAVPGVPEGQVTQFEALTAVALDAFGTAGAEALVVEAGLGGRLDATNVLDADVVALTGVDLDHTELLGETLAEIAGEKLAVAREGLAGVMIGALSPDAWAAVAPILSERGLAGWRAGQEIVVESGNRLPVSISTPNGSTGPLDVPVHGDWQRGNLALAVGAAEQVLGGPVDRARVERAITEMQNPGRLQVIAGSPVIVMDGAHNPAGARALAQSLPEILGDAKPVAVIGMMADKDCAGICDALAPAISAARVTRASSGRAIRPEFIARMLEMRGVPVEVVPGPARALERACADAGPEGAVLVAGSLHLLADLATLAAASGQDNAEEMWGR